MKPLLGLLLALLLATTLAACGDQDAATDPSTPGTPGGTPPAPADGPASDDPPPGSTTPDQGGEVVALLSESAAGGSVEAEVTVLDSDQAVEAYVGQFTGPTLADQVRDAVAAAAPGPGQVVVGAVVWLGCETPAGAVVEASDRVRLVANPKPVAKVECLVPVTTVALAVVDAATVAG
ncbi:hypothetical protein [Nocardioides sp. AE5]|uniref:hypothetical protein n=1 Tax=Nocardioides sp. AE5 TaxID=2962573 RepID=UPI002880E6CD|nr:hypothetical protein [Nocardioides sp. AE5]MDT0203804.1 hypothetical protein [Nocardioides sp. AE5]